MSFATEDAIIDVVRAERRRQDKKWGEQNHSNGTYPGALGELAGLGCSADDARNTCEKTFKHGNGTWTEILWEEVAEALEETDPEKLRAELIQVAAVCVAWCESIDRRGVGVVYAAGEKLAAALAEMGCPDCLATSMDADCPVEARKAKALAAWNAAQSEVTK